MNCNDFLGLYSDWADGLVVDDGQRRALERHRSHCPSCGRTDEVVRRGVMVLKNLECRPVDRRFEARLRARLRSATPAVDEARVPVWAGKAAVMLGLLTLAVVALDLAGRRDARVAHATPEDVPAPMIHAGAPFVTFHDRHVTVLVHTVGEPLVPTPRARPAAFR